MVWEEKNYRDQVLGAHEIDPEFFSIEVILSIEDFFCYALYSFLLNILVYSIFCLGLMKWVNLRGMVILKIQVNAIDIGDVTY